MPGASSGGYLPPVVATLVAENADALAKIAEVEAALAALEKDSGNVRITADASQALAAAAAARAAMQAAAMPPITFTIAIDSMQALAELSAIRALAGIMPPVTIPVTADTGAALAKMAALKLAGSALGGQFGVLGSLLWGTGGIAGFAALGSIASLAGLGFEHVLTTAIGLAGSLAGAIGGGLLLAIGSVGVALVGMGSDLLVMRSAAKDVTNYQNALDKLTRAIAVYGAGSTQARAAQYDLNQVTQGWTAALLQSVQATAAAKQSMLSFWQQVSQAAKIAANGIMQQVYALGTVYAPLIAQAAQRNLTIVSNGIKPLFAWLSTTGTLIFKNLENVFARNLPNAITAFTQGIEFLLKTINFLSGYTGGLTKSIADLLTKANSPAGFAHWESIMLTLIDMWHKWWDLMKIVAHVIVDIFTQSAGLGTSIVVALTKMLTQLDQWLKSTGGQNAVHTLFAVHLQEVLALLGLLPKLLGAFGQLYLTIAPPLTLIVAGLASAVGWMLQIPVVGPIMAWGLAIGFLASQMKLVAIWGVITQLATFGGLLIGIAADEGLAAAGMYVLNAAMLTNPITWVVVAVAALAAGLVLLILHFQQVASFLSGPLGTAISGAVAIFMPLIGIPMLIIGHWQAIWSFLHAIPGWFADAFRTVLGVVTTALGNIGKFFTAAFHAISTTVTTAWTWITTTFSGAFKAIGNIVSVGLTILKVAWSVFSTAIKIVVQALWDYVAQIFKIAFGLIQLWTTVFVTVVTTIFKVFATVATAIFKVAFTVIQAIVTVFVAIVTAIFRVFATVVGAIFTGIGTAIAWVWNNVKAVVIPVVQGIVTVISAIWNGLVTVVNTVGTAIGTAFMTMKVVLGNIWAAVGRDVSGAWNGIVSVVKAAVNTVISVIDAIIGGINKVTGAIPFVGGNLQIPLIPHWYAAGGVIPAGQWGGVGENGPEAVYGGTTGVSVLNQAQLAGAGGGVNMTNHVTINVQGGATNAQTGSAVEGAVINAMHKAIRQMRGGARTYGFMPS